MTVRAKFKVTSITSSQQQVPGRNEAGHDDWQNGSTVEMRTIAMSPVYGNGDPEHENSKFWRASPSGELKLGTINPEAWKHFELGG